MTNSYPCAKCSVSWRSSAGGEDTILFCAKCGKPLYWTDSANSPPLGGRDPTTQAIIAELPENGNRPDESSPASNVGKGQVIAGEAGVLRLGADLSIVVSKMGILTDVYRSQFSDHLGWLLFGLICEGGAVLTYFMVFHWGGITGPRSGIAALAIMVGGPVFGAVFIGLGMLNYVKRMSLLVLSTGIVRIRQANVVICRWDEITEFYRPLRIPFYYSIRKRGGEKFKVGWFNPNLLAKLGQRFEQELGNRIYQNLRDIYASGEEAPFGKFGVSKMGLRFKRKFLAWNQINRLGIERDDAFSVSKKRGFTYWCVVKVNAIPNFTVFRELVERNMHFSASI